jgi:predicted GIY-YIG superfamily endonuclease
MEKYNVYIISNSINNDLYIGTTSLDIEDRFKIHKQHLVSKYSNTKNRSLMYLDMQNYGLDNFNISLIKNNLTKKHALNIESEYQKNDHRFKRYSERDLNRDCRAKFRSCYKLISDDTVLFFKSTV